MSDGITHEMIEAHQRKLAILAALDKMFDGRIEKIRQAKDSTAAAVEKAQAMKAEFMTVAQAQTDEFFAPLANVNAALTAIKPLLKNPR